MRTRGLWVAALLAASCGGGTTTDAGADGSTDASSEAGTDASTDAGGGLGADAGCPDADGDGHRAASCGGDDCDDADARRYTGNTEVCDTTNHDEDCDPTTFGFRDSDHDGYPDQACCNTDGTTMHCGTDCDDANTNVHPSQTETCNGIDDNCDGMIDEGAMVAYYADCDGDGYGAGAPTVRCTPPSTAPPCPGGTWITVGGDCDDTDAMATPGRTEVCDLGTRDEDCDPSTIGPDADGDGEPSTGCCNPMPGGGLHCGLDCDDSRASVGPGGTEVCNFVDDDCNGTIDDAPGGCPADPDVGHVHCNGGPGGLTCDTSTTRCCGPVMGSTGSCDPAGAACGSAFPQQVDCDGPEDCGAGFACFQLNPPGGNNSACLRNGDTRACHHDAQCPVGQICHLPTGTSTSFWGVCFHP